MQSHRSDRHSNNRSKRRHSDKDSSPEKSRRRRSRSRSRSRSADRNLTERILRNGEYEMLSSRERKRVQKLISDSLEAHKNFFTPAQCREIEDKIQETGRLAQKNYYKSCTVDLSPLRNKYFFGEGYTYGSQLERKGPGMERVYPEGYVDPVPQWVKSLVIKPLEDAKIIKKGWVNSAVINDYLPGGCIVSHIDPAHIFDRPVVSASFCADAALAFGVRFTFKPMRTSEPLHLQPLPRGGVLLLQGYAADHVTHCVRPQDVPKRRAVVILRHVRSDAPRLSPEDLPDIPPPVTTRERRRSRSTSRHRRRKRSSSHARRHTSSSSHKIPRRQTSSQSAPPGRLPHCYADLDEDDTEEVSDNLLLEAAVEVNDDSRQPRRRARSSSCSSTASSCSSRASLSSCSSDGSSVDEEHDKKTNSSAKRLSECDAADVPSTESQTVVPMKKVARRGNYRKRERVDE